MTHRQPTNPVARGDALAFAKGHGTENDFVILPDPGNKHDLTGEEVRLITDRRRGIGGDGILRIVRAAAHPEARAQAATAEWFMDYRNADGSIVEMCGNGVRVFATYLREEGLVDGDGPAGEPIAVATRAGTKTVVFEADGTLTVDMGPPQTLGESSTVLNGARLRGVMVSMGNPHLVVDLAGTGLDLPDLDLGTEPDYSRTDFPAGVNQEFYLDDQSMAGTDLHVRMRVHERGVGETRSCGTGICAVAVAALGRHGRDTGTVVVDVPGGRLHTDVSPQRVLLRGPAVIVARGRWLRPSSAPPT